MSASLARENRAKRANPVAPPVYRKDVQALRALAIAAVVLNHLWPTRFPGGYVGVDVFFVISGYLITGHLLKEVVATGGIKLGAFYARRIRRLLPAALVVLAVSAVLVWLFLPYPRWERNAAEIAASAGYVENWLLAGLSVNYSALNDTASIAQHYWSLSVEEQFYLVWPALILFVLWVMTRWRIRTTRSRALWWVLVTVFVLSLSLSVWFTQVEPTQAYFVTFTRAWEFAAGGLIALMGTRVRMPRAAANIAALAGFALIAVVVFAYGPDTPFPGVAALAPVVATSAIIAAGNGHARLLPSIVTDRRSVQWLGGVSYSLYLWHWPLIVIAPFVLQSELSVAARVGLLAAVLVLAGATKILIEDPGRDWSYWKSSTRRSVALMLGAMVVVFALSGALFLGFAVRSSADAPTAPVATGSCDGPSAIANAQECPDALGPAVTPYMTKRNEYFFYPDQCGTTQPDANLGEAVPVIVCDFTNSAQTAHDVWVVGDSHAQQWQGAIFELAREHRWRVTLAYRGHCPPADVAYVGFRALLPEAEVSGCREWSRAVSAAVQQAQPATVFTAMAARQYLLADDGSGRSLLAQFEDGLLTDWAAWADAGIRVFAIADPPFNGEVRDPDCALVNSSDPRACSRPRAEAQPDDPVVSAVERAMSRQISLIDLTDFFCDVDQCFSVVGGVPVYYDADHLNLVYVRMLAPHFEAQMAR